MQLPASGTYYVSIMAVDAKGVAIGKTNYMLSEEIKLQFEQGIVIVRLRHGRKIAFSS